MAYQIYFTEGAKLLKAIRIDSKNYNYESY